MNLEYVPILRIQRELQGLPRGVERFQQYLRTVSNGDGSGLALPSLSIMNPMGKDHVTVLLDQLLAMDADGIAARVTAELSMQLASDPGEFKVALVVADDLLGGWTNRYDYEFKLRFPSDSDRLAAGELPKWLQHFWITAVLWSSDAPSEEHVREAILTAVHRVAFIQRHGSASTLRDMLAQEGRVMALAGCSGPTLDADDLAYTREVIAPLLEARDMRTVIECLFGDAAGRTLGFTARGLSPWAGIALALHDARRGAAPQSHSTA